MNPLLQLHKPLSFKMTGVVLVPRELWQKCMDILQDELPSQQFNTWLRPLKVMADQDELCLLAPNRFVLDWVKDKYLPRIEEIFMEFSDGNPPAIALGVSNRRPSFGIRSSSSSTGASGSGLAGRTLNASKEQLTARLRQSSALGGRSTLEPEESKRQTHLFATEGGADSTISGNTLPSTTNTAPEPPAWAPEPSPAIAIDIASEPVFEAAPPPVETSPAEDNAITTVSLTHSNGTVEELHMESSATESTFGIVSELPEPELVDVGLDTAGSSLGLDNTSASTSTLTAPVASPVSSSLVSTVNPLDMPSGTDVLPKDQVVDLTDPFAGLESDPLLFTEPELEPAPAQTSTPEPEPALVNTVDNSFEPSALDGEEEPSADDQPTGEADTSTVIMPSGGRSVDVEGSMKHTNALNRGFVFESFVEGKSNQLALAAARQVAENPGNAYNPLFLYGGVGLGKTHLMHAIGNQLARQNPDAKIVYLHSERFVADMVKALQLNAINDFKRYYRSVDALLIDDIQFFAGKERSQEEFFHTFNALLEGGQQMILTCDRYPKEIGGLEERLRSRFGWGLTVAVEPPELETRVAILMKKAEQAKIELPHEAAFFIAQRIRSNVRELEGALKRVIANAHFMGRKIDISLIRESLKDLLALQDKQVGIENIQRLVAEYYKIKVVDILSKSRTRTVARPRQIAMALSKELTSHSLPEIGAAYGGRDHTTVLHACRKVVELCQADAEIAKDYKSLLHLLTN